MKPTTIPKGMGIEGAEKRKISGKEAGAADVEALVGRTSFTVGEEEIPTLRYSMLVECDEIDVRSLHLDPRFWLHLYGTQIQPFGFDTAFVSPVAPTGDPVAEELRAAGKLLASAWYHLARGQRAELERALEALRAKALAADAALNVVSNLPGGGSQDGAAT